MPLYATIGKLRLFASPGTVVAADEVMHRIVTAYYSPALDFTQDRPPDRDAYDVLRAFIDACQAELNAVA